MSEKPLNRNQDPGQPPKAENHSVLPDKDQNNGCQQEPGIPYSISIKQTAPNSIGIQQKSKKKRRDALDWAKFIILFLAMISAAAAAVFTWWQADIAKNTANKQLRAYVFAKPMPHMWGVKLRPQIYVYFRNGGQTPADDLKLQATIRISEKPPSPNEFVGLPEIEIDRVLDPSAEIRDGRLINFDRPLTAEEITRIDAGTTLRFYVFGTIGYKDVFDDPHHTYFCFSYFGLADFQDVLPPVNRGVRAINLSFCNTPKSD